MILGRSGAEGLKLLGSLSPNNYLNDQNCESVFIIQCVVSAFGSMVCIHAK